MSDAAAPLPLPTLPLVSVVIPARNEEVLLGETIEAVLTSIACWAGVPLAALSLPAVRAEVLVVDNDSTDRTPDVVARFVASHGVTLVSSRRRGAPSARNDGAERARGRVLVFVDADTLVAPATIGRVVDLCEREGAGAGIGPLTARDGGWRARAWWAWWGLLRQLPIARAKAMPALLFCTRRVFDDYGPFDESVAIGEEWPILADLYQREPAAFRYEPAVGARTSSRRMELQPFGYTRVLLRYTWAVLHASGRRDYGDHVRHRPPAGSP